MSKKHHTPEQIISNLREVELLLSQGQNVPLACKRIEVSEQTYYNWQKEYGGRSPGPSQALQETRSRGRAPQEARGRPQPRQAHALQEVIQKRLWGLRKCALWWLFSRIASGYGFSSSERNGRALRRHRPMSDCFEDQRSAVHTGPRLSYPGDFEKLCVEFTLQETVPDTDRPLIGNQPYTGCLTGRTRNWRRADWPKPG